MIAQSCTIYFLGAYRPCYIEAETSLELARKISAAIASMPEDLRAFLAQAWQDITKEIQRKNYAAMSIEHCNKGISWQSKPIDDWTRGLAASLGDMPAAPGLDYDQGIV
ncbi:hypothetical protein OOT33_13815 [Sphingobium sp. DEHP117]|uniref:hypothetical protein n=1 Tax=Sphingobium sp. DEHP117 TaxID=2993436 RepID=UPI0027D5326D|nr:hypothetical protein [Sphingobium sp. DEHP117]MDQ4421500.1 hypothetical protein [Sphingobium sp. DEHP117]